MNDKARIVMLECLLSSSGEREAIMQRLLDGKERQIERLREQCEELAAQRELSLERAHWLVGDIA